MVSIPIPFTLKKFKMRCLYKTTTEIFYVEILDSRNKVLILSDAPHPDVAALQSVLSEDDIEVEYKTFEAWDKKVNNINLLICHNPSELFSTELFKLFKNKNIPVLYVLGSKTHKGIYSKLGIQFSNESSNQIDEFQGAINEGFSILRLKRIL